MRAEGFVGLVSRTSFSTGDIPTAAQWNTQFDSVYNEFNGNIEAVNLKTSFKDTIAILSENETITGNWTHSGTITANAAVQINSSLTVTGFLSAASASATILYGTLQTAAQTNITSLGTLGNLVISGGCTAASAISTYLYGTLQTATQSNITSVGTLGSLTVSGNMTVDTSTLYVDSTLNRVGIGYTSNLTASLSVSGDVEARAGTGSDYVAMNFSSTYSAIAGSALCSLNATNNGAGATPYMSFLLGSVEKMRLDTSGNLGIGGSAESGMRLDVIGGKSSTKSATGSDWSAWQTQAISSPSEIRHLATNNGTVSAPFVSFYTSGIERLRIGASGGLVVGTATSGDKGYGTINVLSDIYKNSSAYTNPDYVFECFYTGRIEKYANNPGASKYGGIKPLKEVWEYVKDEWRLPGITDDAQAIFARSDFILEKIEEIYLYLFDIEKRLSSLEVVP